MRDKQSIREAMRKKIMRKTQSFFDKKSPFVIQKLLDMDLLRTASAVGCYLSVKREVQTDEIFNFCRQKNIKTFVPAFYEAENIYVWTEYKLNCVLEKGPFGIPQPSVIKTAGVSEIDVFIVPGLAFDLSGVRLGHGKGFFDRLLAIAGGNCRNKIAVVIGLAFEFQILTEIPALKHDVRMDYIVTEKKIIVC